MLTSESRKWQEAINASRSSCRRRESAVNTKEVEQGFKLLRIWRVKKRQLFRNYVFFLRYCRSANTLAATIHSNEIGAIFANCWGNSTADLCGMMTKDLDNPVLLKDNSTRKEQEKDPVVLISRVRCSTLFMHTGLSIVMPQVFFGPFLNTGHFCSPTELCCNIQKSV